MKLRPVLPLALALGAAACASAPSDPSAPVDPAASLAASASGSAAPREASAPASERELVSSAAPSDASAAADDAAAAVRDVFASRAFGERFAESYLAVTEVEPRVTSVEVEQMTEIFDAVRAEDYREALELLDEHGGKKNANAVFDFTRGNVYWELDRLDEAGAAYARAVEKQSRFLRAWKMLGQVRLRTEDFEGALPALVKTIELGGGDAITYGLLGVAHLNTGDPVAAESALRMAALLDPATLQWRIALVDSFLKQERFRDAIALLDAILEDDPGQPKLLIYQAGAFLRVGEPLRAAESYELADALGGATAESLSNLGDIYVNAELFDLGVDAHLRALAMDPAAAMRRAITASRSMVARGALQPVKELVAGVEEHAGESIELDTRKDILKLRSRIAVAEGAGDEEARVLAEIVELDPLDGEALILLGQHAARNEEPERAEFLYERAAGIEGFEAEAKMRHGELLVGKARYQEALALLRRSQELKPRDYLQEFIDKVERVAQNR